MQDLVVTQPRAREANFDDLIGPYLEDGYRTALVILRNHVEAHDAVQEAAFKAWQRMGQLRDPKSARSWFLAIVSNQCRSMRRTRWWSVIRLPDVRLEEPAVTSDATDLERALARLEREDRLALFLYFYLDLPLDEIGAILGLTAAGAKTRIYRAAKKLRPDLEIS